MSFFVYRFVGRNGYFLYSFGVISKTALFKDLYNNQVRKSVVYESFQSNIPFILGGCTLWCRKEYFLLPIHYMGFVKDGTKCLHGSDEGNGVCIGGNCMV